MRAALLALVLLLALPASAHAGRAERHDYREFGVRGEPTVATGEVRYAATEGAGTRITVRQVGGAVEIVDTGGAEAGPGCRSDAPDRVTCPDSTRAILDAGDGDDVVDGVGLAAFAVQAREGDDSLTGGPRSSTAGRATTSCGPDPPPPCCRAARRPTR